MPIFVQVPWEVVRYRIRKVFIHVGAMSLVISLLLKFALFFLPATALVDVFWVTREVGSSLIIT